MRSELSDKTDRPTSTCRRLNSFELINRQFRTAPRKMYDASSCLSASWISLQNIKLWVLAEFTMGVQYTSGNGNVSPEHAIKAWHSLLILELDGSERSASRSGRFVQDKRSLLTFNRRLVGLQSWSERFREKNLLSLPAVEPWPLSYPARSLSICRIRHPGSWVWNCNMPYFSCKGSRLKINLYVTYWSGSVT